MSVLAWARQPPGAPGHRALARIVEQLACLRAVGLDRCGTEGVHPERLRQLAREGGRLPPSTCGRCRRFAAAPRSSPPCSTRRAADRRRRGPFDRAVGRMFRRAEAREEEAVLRDARAVNDKVRLLAKLGSALIEAKQDGADLDGAVAASVGWDRLAASVAEARQLARPDKADLPALATRAWPVLHRLGPLFLGAFQLRAVPAAASTLRAIELLGGAYDGGGRKWPSSLPISFLRPAWRDAVHHAAVRATRRQTWEAATLLALRDRLRSGDIWVEGSRQWRAVEESEPRRVSRRLQILREWSHGEEDIDEICAGGPGASGTDGAGAPGRPWVAMGGDRLDRGEDRLHGGDAARLGSAG